MRVLLLHNRYRAQGGEERAVAEIGAMLERRGHTVNLIDKSSEDGWPARVRAAAGLLRGGLEPEQVAEAVRRERIDIVHAHNLHPLFGWRALAAGRAAGAATILHLHNFRLTCAIGVAYRDGAPCFRCRGVDTSPGLRLRCRGSLPEAAVYAAGLSLQHRRLLEHSDAFVALGESHLSRLLELGLPDDGRAEVLPNLLTDARFASASRAGEGEYALVAGRLVEEKGFDTAIAAARMGGVPLVVAGTGPDEARLRRLAEGADVRFTGWLDEAELDRVRERAAVVLAPSRWEEPCPYSVIEAMAQGIPVLVSDRGGLPELVGAERALPAENPVPWAGALMGLWADPRTRRLTGEDLLTEARLRFGEDRYHERLMRIYERALGRAR
jgi:glycosyltransferase involved in cell wall biosynthesis